MIPIISFVSGKRIPSTTAFEEIAVEVFEPLLKYLEEGEG